MKMKKTIFTIVMASMFLHACYYDNEEDLYPTSVGSSCDTSNVGYVQIIEPMISNNCSSCHYGNNPSGGTNFETHSSFQGVATSASANLLCRIKHESGCNPMPQGGGKLSDCNILKIETWINSGMPM